MAGADWSVRDAVWSSDAEALLRVRLAVFVNEQGVPFELEQDGDDEHAIHVLAETLRGEPIGTGRLLSNGHIGRMAVLRDYRGQGVGSAMLQWLMAQARSRLGLQQVFLNAQVHALPFYAPHGFTAEGEVFDDAGLPHRKMQCSI